MGLTTVIRGITTLACHVLYPVFVNSQTWRLQYVWHKCESAGSFFPVSGQVSIVKQPEADWTVLCTLWAEHPTQINLLAVFFLQTVVHIILSFLTPKICTWPATSCWRPQPETARHLQQPPLSVKKCTLDQNQFSNPDDRHGAFFQTNGILNHYIVHNIYRRPSFE
jgi:hypothetical protein